MTDYYKLLGIRRTASVSEVKSAYRKLARLRHPDLNAGSETAAGDFALLSRAYRVLMDPQERAYYDEQLRAQRERGPSILHSNNPHAQRARDLSAQARWDRVVNEVLERDRLETRERQRAVFTTVSLFLSTFFVAMIRPRLWETFGYFGRAIVVTLFVIGLWHLVTRLREYFDHYTYNPRTLGGSRMKDGEKPEQPFTRFSAFTFLLVGYGVSSGRGHFGYDSSMDQVRLHWPANGDSLIQDGSIDPTVRRIAGSGSVLTDTNALFPSTWHPLGGANMGAVCDLDGRVHGQRGLYVLDGALMPGTTAACNPSMTIAALAERALDNIVADDIGTVI